MHNKKIISHLDAEPARDLEGEEASAEGHAEERAKRAAHAHEGVLPDDVDVRLTEDDPADEARGGGAYGDEGSLGSEARAGEDRELGRRDHGQYVMRALVPAFVDALYGVGEVARLAEVVNGKSAAYGHCDGNDGYPQEVQILRHGTFESGKVRQLLPNQFEEVIQSVVVRVRHEAAHHPNDQRHDDALGNGALGEVHRVLDEALAHLLEHLVLYVLEGAVGALRV